MSTLGFIFFSGVIMPVVKHCIVLPKEAEESQVLEILKPQLEATLSCS